LEGQGRGKLLLIPYRIIETVLPRLGITEGEHWHVIVRLEDDKVDLWLRGGGKFDLTEYVIASN
jgi:hypothetical protein